MFAMITGLVLFLVSDEMVGIYVFAFGAILLTIVRLTALLQRQGGGQLTRLPQIRLLSAAILLGAAYLLYADSNSWSVLLLVSAVLELYVTFRAK